MFLSLKIIVKEFVYVALLLRICNQMTHSKDRIYVSVKSVMLGTLECV